MHRPTPAVTGDPEPLPASIEVSPKLLARDRSLLGQIPRGTRVHIVDTGATDVATWVQSARIVASADLVPVPHVAARRISSVRDIEARLGAMSRDAGVRDALVIGGGAASPAGPFASSMDLLDTGLFEAHGIRDIGIAGHPEGSPDVPATAIDQARAWKVAWAERTGVRLRIVTQFSFDATATRAWIDRLAGLNVTLPLHVGIAGPTGLASLLRYAALCGVKASATAAARRGSALSALVTSYTPEPFAQSIEAHAARPAGRTIAGLHVFPFGGLAATAAWLAQRGSWASDTARDGDSA